MTPSITTSEFTNSAPAALNIWLESRVCGSSPALQNSRCDEGEWGVTKLRHGFLLLEEMSHDFAEVFVFANVFGRPSTRNDQRYIVSRIHIFESEIGVPRIAGLLGGRIESRLEIVDHKAQFLLCGCRDLNLVAFL